MKWKLEHYVYFHDVSLRKYVQKWSGKWKLEIRQQVMRERKDIIASTTCQRSSECIQEMNTFWKNGYNVNILFVFADSQECQQMGTQREQVDGRKYIQSNYGKAMWGCIDVIDHFVQQNMLFQEQNFVVIRNHYNITERSFDVVNDDWDAIKNQVLVPMLRRDVAAND